MPFIMRWPGQIAANSQCKTPIVGYDLLPTFVSLAGGTADQVDGIDISPLFENSTKQFDRELIFHFPYYHPERGYNTAIDEIGSGDFAVSKTHPQSAIISGDQKLLYFYEEPRSEFYDLSTDVGEQNAATTSRVADELKHRLLNHLEQMQARFPTRKDE